MNINTGPLTREVYEICLLNEKQAASPEQTAVAIRLSALGNAVETMERENGVAAETLVKVNAWIAEAKPLLERGGKAETALAAADSDRESLRACVVRLKEAMALARKGMSNGYYDGDDGHPGDVLDKALKEIPADLSECVVVKRSEWEALEWRDIGTFNRKEMQFVLVLTNSNEVRLLLWNPHRRFWENAPDIRTDEIVKFLPIPSTEAALREAGREGGE